LLSRINRTIGLLWVFILPGVGTLHVIEKRGEK
jgi:hypothetical protein